MLSILSNDCRHFFYSERYSNCSECSKIKTGSSDASIQIVFVLNTEEYFCRSR